MKLIHGLWHDASPPVEGNYTASWRKMNPDAQIRIWTFAEAEAVLNRTHPELMNVYNNMAWIVGRAGMLRYALIEEFGGIYMDLDIECLRPLDPLFEMPLALQYCKRGDFELIQDGMFGAHAHHPFFKAILERPGIAEIHPQDCIRASMLWGALPLLQVMTRGKFQYDSQPMLDWDETPNPYTKHWTKGTWHNKTVPKPKSTMNVNMTTPNYLISINQQQLVNLRAFLDRVTMKGGTEATAFVELLELLTPQKESPKPIPPELLEVSSAALPGSRQSPVEPAVDAGGPAA